ncbi:MAG: metallophosphoesterase [Thermoplasmata archaeon]|nr:MAG: metallophosphoesterase [Thermoplasmata archaeon]
MGLRFAHMADTHLGAFRDPVLRGLNLDAFLRALEIVREEGCEFLVIAGDMFDTSLPDMEVADRAAEGLRVLMEAGVRTYVLYGSHDRSLTEKGIVDVLESAGLFTNVGVLDLDHEEGHPPLTVDGPTGAVMAAVGGRQLTLERALFEAADWEPLARAVADAPLAIFGYHGPVEGMMPEELERLETLDRGRLPPGFHYYALGHVHHHTVEVVHEGGVAVYPSPTFGASFTDLADGREKGLVIVDVDDDGTCYPRHVPISMAPMEVVDLAVAGLSAEEATRRLGAAVDVVEPDGALVLLRLHGALSSGRPTDIPVGRARTDLEERGARGIFVNRRGLRKPRTAGSGEGGGIEGLDRAQIERGALEAAIPADDAPVPWLAGSEGIALAEELLAVAKEPQGDLAKAKYEERVKGRAMEVLALHERPGPGEGGEGA